MEITKQQLFAMYLANEKLKVLYCGKPYEVLAHHKETNLNPAYLEIKYEGSILNVNISDCQLILKPVSEMSKTDMTEFCILSVTENPFMHNVENIKGVFTDGKTITYDYFYNGINEKENRQGKIYLSELKVNQFLWLIQNGYALSDEYFTNGWAVRERDVK